MNSKAMNSNGRRVVIGVGGAGKNVLAQMGATVGVTRIHINTDRRSLAQADAEEKLYIDRADLAPGKQSLDVDFSRRLVDLCRNRPAVIIVGGPHSFDGAQLAVGVARLLINQNSPLQAILFEPFSIEPHEHFAMAMDALSSMKPWLSLSVISLQNQAELMDGDSPSLEQVLYRANWIAIEMAIGQPANHTEGIVARVSKCFPQTVELGLMTVNLVCRIDEVSIVPAPSFGSDAVHDQTMEPASERQAIEGQLSCWNLIGSDANEGLLFSMDGMTYRFSDNLGFSEQVIAGEFARLERCMGLNEAVVVSFKHSWNEALDLGLMDPTFTPTGFEYEHLLTIAADQDVTPGFYL